jgi:hypothetical protein
VLPPCAAMTGDCVAGAAMRELDALNSRSGPTPCIWGSDALRWWSRALCRDALVPQKRNCFEGGLT